MNAKCSHELWFTLKTAQLLSSMDSSLPLLNGTGGSGLVCESVGNTHLQSTRFNSKQSKDPVDLLFTCHPSPSQLVFFLERRPHGPAPRFCVYFGGFYISVAFLLAGDWLMSPQF